MFRCKKCFVCGEDFNKEKALELHLLGHHDDLFQASGTAKKKAEERAKQVELNYVFKTAPSLTIPLLSGKEAKRVSLDRFLNCSFTVKINRVVYDIDEVRTHDRSI